MMLSVCMCKHIKDTRLSFKNTSEQHSGVPLVSQDFLHQQPVNASFFSCISHDMSPRHQWSMTIFLRQRTRLVDTLLKKNCFVVWTTSCSGARAQSAMTHTSFSIKTTISSIGINTNHSAIVFTWNTRCYMFKFMFLNFEYLNVHVFVFTFPPVYVYTAQCCMRPRIKIFRTTQISVHFSTFLDLWGTLQLGVSDAHQIWTSRSCFWAAGKGI